VIADAGGEIRGRIARARVFPVDRQQPARRVDEIAMVQVVVSGSEPLRRRQCRAARCEQARDGPGRR
jgi:hypothetical protein